VHRRSQLSTTRSGASVSEMRAGKTQGDRTMRYANPLPVAIAAVALTFLSAPGQAAPMSDTAGGLKTTAGNNTLIEQVRHRCYWYRGHWRCPRHRYYRDYGPGIHFYLGPRYRPYRHWRRWRD
jgi:hypothetical protein